MEHNTLALLAHPWHKSTKHYSTNSHVVQHEARSGRWPHLGLARRVIRWVLHSHKNVELKISAKTLGYLMVPCETSVCGCRRGGTLRREDGGPVHLRRNVQGLVHRKGESRLHRWPLLRWVRRGRPLVRVQQAVRQAGGDGERGSGG